MALKRKKNDENLKLVIKTTGYARTTEFCRVGIAFPLSPTQLYGSFRPHYMYVLIYRHPLGKVDNEEK